MAVQLEGAYCACRRAGKIVRRWSTGSTLSEFFAIQHPKAGGHIHIIEVYYRPNERHGDAQYRMADETSEELDQKYRLTFPRERVK